MPVRSNPFQTMVRALQSAVQLGGTVTESKLLTDKTTGLPREVDIVVDTAVGPYGLVLSFECISTRRRADVGWVEEMHAKHASLPTDKLFLVSKSGFSQQALQKARFHNHVPCSLGRPDECKWAELVSEHRRIFLQDLRAAVLSFAGRAFVGRSLHLEDRLRRPACDLDVSVSEVVDTILAKPKVLGAAVDLATTAEGKGAVIELAVSSGLEAIDVSGSTFGVDRLSIAVVFEVRRTKIDLTPGFINDHVVSFGGARTDAGSMLHVAIVQARERRPAVTVSEFGTNGATQHRQLVDGFGSELRPLTDATMKRVLHGCD